MTDHETDGIPRGSIPAWMDGTITSGRGMQVYPAGTVFVETLRGEEKIMAWRVRAACAIAAEAAK